MTTSVKAQTQTENTRSPAMTRRGFSGKKRPSENEELIGQNVWIVAEEPDLTLALQDLCRLAGLQFHDADLHLRSDAAESSGSQDAAGLVLVQVGCKVPVKLRALPRITVGFSRGKVWSKSDRAGALTDDAASSAAGHTSKVGVVQGDIQIPGDEVRLVRALSSWSRSERRQTTIYLVGAWHGGGGSTTSALSLAHARGGILLDAAGNHSWWIPPQDGAVWEDFNVSDLPESREIVAVLPRQSGVPTLTNMGGAPRRPDDEQVAAMLTVLSRDVVVDCGTQIEHMMVLSQDVSAVGKRVQIVLVGGASETAVRSLGKMLSWHFQKTGLDDFSLLLVGRPSPLFMTLVDRYRVQWMRAPKPRQVRRWATLVTQLRGGSFYG